MLHRIIVISPVPMMLLGLLLFSVLPAGADYPEEPNCRPIIARQHRAWDQVFSVFPERADSFLEVDAYVAMHCSNLGERYYLYANNYENKYLVEVQDCRARHHVPADGHEPFDLDIRAWRHARLPNAPTPVVLCTLEPE